MEDTNDSAVVLMALCYVNRKLAIACYDELTNTIMASVYDLSHDEAEAIIQSIKQSMEPTLFLLHPNIISNAALLSLILRGLDGSENFYRYKALKSSSWQDSKSYQVIYHNLTLRSKSVPNIKALDMYLVLSRHIEIDQSVLRQALVALITFMQDTVFNLEEGKVTVAAVIPFPNNTYLQMDSNTFKALQIFHEDNHPNWIKGKGRSKEGFSLFGLFDRTLSKVGRYKLKEWMAKPFCDMDRILQRQEGVAFAIREFYQDFMKVIGAHMRHFHDLPRLLLRVKKVEANFTDWCQLHSSLVAASIIVNQLKDFSDNEDSRDDSAAFVKDLTSGIHFTVAGAIAERMAQVIDFAASEVNQELYVRDEVDETLDNKRTLYENLQGFLIDAAQSILSATPLLEKVSVEYVPQVGYLAVIEDYYVNVLRNGGYIEDTPLPSRDEEFVEEEIMDRQNSTSNKFVFVFSQDEKFYFKHQIVYRLDQELGDLKSDLADLQRNIIIKLEEEILDAELLLMQISSLIGTFDAFLSFGTMAIQCNMTQPQIVEDEVIIIKEGRHLLQELSVDNFVPNDTFITKDKNIAIITGPNSCGKSVYLKQVGLITYLAHIGSWVPCEKAVIGLTDRIMSRIVTEETVSNPQSTFSIDLNQMAKITQFHTVKSLCLVDEFGKGTNPIDGMSLLAATMKHFSTNKSKILFTTHFTEIVHGETLTSNTLSSINCFKMETIKEEDNGEEDSEKIIPLYKLKYGVETDSEGIACAANLGVDPEVIKRAKFVKANIQNKSKVSISQKAAAAIFKNTNCREILTLFLTTDFEKAENAEVVQKMRALLGREFP